MCSQGTYISKGLSYSSYRLSQGLIMELNFLLSFKVQAIFLYPLKA